MRRRGVMGRDGEGGCRQKGVYLRGVPSHGLEDGVWKKTTRYNKVQKLYLYR